jgi:hypothetical protein
MSVEAVQPVLLGHGWVAQAANDRKTRSQLAQISARVR